MYRTRKLFVSTMIAAAGAVSTALMLSPTASADPVAPVAPAPNPGAELLTQLSSIGSAAPQLIQGLATAMSGTAAPAAAPTTPPAGATASPRRQHLRQAPPPR
jgi:hypothetical protein